MMRRPAILIAAALALIAADDPPSAAPPSALPSALPHNPGAIFQASAGNIPLTSGLRAGAVGDVVTILLVERTQGNVTNSSGTDRDSSIGLTPPTTGLLSILRPTDLAMGGNSTFAGRGTSAQSHNLSGEISVTVTQVLPNGSLVISGEKHMRINRGQELVRVSGTIRPSDISADNHILSTRIANVEIEFTGRGEIARAGRQGWLQRFFSMISPF
ncbi:MAG: flagellar basal body L-ring protein FlgH [Sphingopyxis sp.]